MENLKDDLEMLKQSQKEAIDFKSALELSFISVTTDVEGIITKVNDKFCSLSKFKKEELIGKNIQLINSGFHDDAFFADLWETIKNGKTWNGEIKNKAKDGSTFWVDATILSFTNDDGKPYQYIALLKDISELRNGEEKLIQSSRNKENALNRITDGIFILDNEWRYTFMNEAAQAAYPLEITKIIGKTIWEIHPEIIGTLFESKYREAMLTRKALTIEDVYELQNKWFSINIYPSKDGLAFLIKNIDERKNAEQKLILSENRLLKAQEIGKLGYWQQDLRSDTIWVSKEAMRIYGFKAIEGELLRETIGNCVIEKELVAQAREDLLQHNKKYNIEFRIHPADGSTIKHISAIAELEHDKNGSPVKVIGTLQDITERKKIEQELSISEEKYKYLFDNNPAIIIIWELGNLKIIEVNNQAIELYGYSREEFLRLTLLEIRPEADRDKIKKFSEEMLHSNVSKIRRTWRHEKKNGELMHMDITSHKIEFNNKTRILSLAKDITEQVNAENELKDKYDDIRRLNAHLQTIREEERTAVAREIHDELGQQLTGLKMDASWLLKKITSNDGENAKREKLLEMISLIDETVKTVRRISSNLRPAILDDFGLIPALEWQCSEFEKRNGIKNTITSNVSDLTLNKTTSIGIFRIYQESLTNILRHAQASLVNTTIKCNQHKLVLSIKDNGIGFDTSLVKAKRTLGLEGMRERALELGGLLTIESAKGKGTKLTVELPLI